ncbi:hypothetical protein V2J09_006117 [Rumex salicifolius]
MNAKSGQKTEKNDENLGGNLILGSDNGGQETAAKFGRGGEGGEPNRLTLVAATTQTLVVAARDGAYTTTTTTEEPSVVAATTEEPSMVEVTTTAMTEKPKLAAATQALTTTAQVALAAHLVGGEVKGSVEASKRAGAEALVDEETKVVVFGTVIVGLRLLLRPEGFDSSTMAVDPPVVDPPVISYADGISDPQTYDAPPTRTLLRTTPIETGGESVVPEEQGVGMTTEEQDVLWERDDGSALPEDGVRRGAHEEEGEDEGAKPMQVGPQPGGPRDMSLLRSYLTHKAPVIWTAIERLTLPNAEPVDPSRDPVIADMVGVTFDHYAIGDDILILTVLDRCKELCRPRERNESQVASMYFLMLLSSTVSTDKMTQKVKLKYASLVLDLDHVGDHAWGADVLALMYNHLGQASRHH